MPTRIPLILIVALTTALIAAGCGDDDEETTTTATTEESATGPTGATGGEGASTGFAQQADDICREGNDEIDAEAQERFGDTQEPSQDEQLSFAEEVVIPSIQSQVDEISALTPPEGEEDTFDEFISQAQSDLDEIESDPSVLLQQGGGEDPFAETNELARELGLTVCGEG